MPHFEFTEEFIIIKVLTKIAIKHKTMMKCEVKSNFIIKAKLIKRYKSLMDVRRTFTKKSAVEQNRWLTPNTRNIKIYKNRVRLGAPRPRRPLAFVQPCPMGVTPLPPTIGQSTSAVSTTLPAYNLRPSSLLCCRPDGLKLSTGRSPGPGSQQQQLQATT